MPISFGWMVSATTVKFSISNSQPLIKYYEHCLAQSINFNIAVALYIYSECIKWDILLSPVQKIFVDFMWKTFSRKNDWAKYIERSPKNKIFFDQFKHQKFGGILQQLVIFDSSIFGCFIQGSLIFQRLFYNNLQGKLLYNVINAIS